MGSENHPRRVFVTFKFRDAKVAARVAAETTPE